MKLHFKIDRQAVDTQLHALLVEFKAEIDMLEVSAREACSRFYSRLREVDVPIEFVSRVDDE